jgi:hypothetical protein
VPSSVVTLLLVLLVLQVKHFLFDYPLQSHFQLRNKVIYGHVGGLLHSALHILGTSVVFLIARPSLAVGAAILIGEFLVHYHLDWAKGQLNKRNRLTVTDALYWWGIGIDQMLHHMTYLAIAAVLYATGAMG